ncbi:hypothetical protein AVEN_176049-1 [Araneus ventricosus]|uniref:Uncharacterized protein n=2 Tax=Araneus ventricosus TaxID=182803 RepID=A0A4Y2F6X2_ARAVE|nr:hypothetical protein AVEN_176049-1 [Araneus ventricosus]
MLAGLPMIPVPRALSPLPDVPKPPVAKAVSLSLADKRSQDYVHREIMVVLCIRADGFTLSTGRVSYSCDRPSKKRLRTSLAEICAHVSDGPSQRAVGHHVSILPPCVSSLDGGAKRCFRFSSDENGRDSTLNDVRAAGPMRDWLQLLAEYKRAAPIARPHYI